jgi:hypothetical protein
MKNILYILQVLYVIFATMCLGILLLLPFINLFLLREVIYQETGRKVNFWERVIFKNYQNVIKAKRDKNEPNQ